MFDDLQLLQKDIKQLYIQSAFSFVGILGIIIFGGFFVLLLFAKQWTVMFIFLFLLILSIILLIVRQKIINQMKRKTPYIIKSKHPISYLDVLEYLNAFALEEDKLEISKEQSMFKINNDFNYRVLVSKTKDFNKKEYDSIKRTANKKFNAKYQPKQWVNRTVANRMLRINIICADKINADLNDYISTNAAQMLRRVEGIMRFVVCDDMIYIPPVYGDIDLAEVDRYNKSIRFLMQILDI